ncbi:MAG: PIN domain-containing protein [Candidatus Micrarchaeota archaeon]
MILDSSVFIAAANKSDENFKLANELLLMAERASAKTTDHVLEEVVTYLCKKAGSDIAYKTGIGILGSFELVYFSEDNLREALELVKKYRRLSLCDALSVVAASEMRDKAICSFDSDFDFVKGIKRVF